MEGERLAQWLLIVESESDALSGYNSAVLHAGRNPSEDICLLLFVLFLLIC